MTRGLKKLNARDYRFRKRVTVRCAHHVETIPGTLTNIGNPAAIFLARSEVSSEQIIAKSTFSMRANWSQSFLSGHEKVIYRQMGEI
jgi:hypothetical protein